MTGPQTYRDRLAQVCDEEALRLTGETGRSALLLARIVSLRDDEVGRLTDEVQEWRQASTDLRARLVRAEQQMAATPELQRSDGDPGDGGSRLRRAGSPWRLLAHEWLPGTGQYGTSHHVTNQASFGGRTPDGEFTKTHLLESTEFDELVVGRWIHIEQMTSSVFWMNVSGATINIGVDRDGRPRSVDVYGPDDYATAEPGVAYSLTWQHPDRYTAPLEAGGGGDPK